MRSAPFVLALAIASAFVAMASGPAVARESRNEIRTEHLFNKISDDPLKLRIFLQAMPKGGDLHNHLAGDPYPEEYLTWAGERNLCIDRKTLDITSPPCKPPAREPTKDLSTEDPALWNAAIDAMSVRGQIQGVGANDRSMHDAFFSTFAKFSVVAAMTTGPSIATALRQAAANKASYVEIIHSPKALFDGAAHLTNVKWGAPDLAQQIDSDKGELADIVHKASKEMDEAEAEARQDLGCKKAPQALGCAVTVRYLTYTLRNGKLDDAFRSFLTSFAMVKADPRFVGVNIVGPEDEYNAVKNYDQHMQMIKYLSARYPNVKKTLHAGELSLGLAPAYALKDHIRKAIEIAGAERIGHGTDIAFENGALQLLNEMAKHRIDVEINLTSNADILGTTGKHEPLQLYIQHGVPISLSTDDQGISRIDLTHEYVMATYDHHLSYEQLKQAARNSLEYAFVSGASLWQDGDIGTVVPQCKTTDGTPSPGCQTYLDNNEKARLEMALEHQFQTFEAWAAHAEL